MKSLNKTERTKKQWKLKTLSIIAVLVVLSTNVESDACWRCRQQQDGEVPTPPPPLVVDAPEPPEPPRQPPAAGGRVEIVPAPPDEDDVVAPTPIVEPAEVPPPPPADDAVNSPTIVDDLLDAIADAESQLDPQSRITLLDAVITRIEESKEADGLEDVLRLLRADRSVTRGAISASRHRYAEAVDHYQDALKLDPSIGLPHNNLAWLYATCPEKEFRDGALALKHARRACDANDWDDPYTFDTLAAAAAESGDFEDAIYWQRKAAAHKDLAKELLPQVEERLQLYRDNKPFRELPEGSVDTEGLNDSQIHRKYEAIKELALGWAGPLSESADWVLDGLERKKLQLDDYAELAKNWWREFEVENSKSPKVLLRLAEEMRQRNITIIEYYHGYVTSGVDDAQGVLHYIEYARIAFGRFRAKVGHEEFTARLGAMVEETDDGREHTIRPIGNAVVVTKLLPDSRGAAAGLQAEDVIVSFAGEEIESAHHLIRLIGQAEPYLVQQLVVQRNGNKEQLTVALFP